MEPQQETNALLIETKPIQERAIAKKYVLICVIVILTAITTAIILFYYLQSDETQEKDLIHFQQNGWKFGDNIQGYSWTYNNEFITNKTYTNTTKQCAFICQNNHIYSCTTWKWNQLNHKCIYTSINSTQTLQYTNNMISGCGSIQTPWQCQQRNTACSNYTNQSLSINGSQRLIQSNGLQRCYYAFIPSQCMNQLCSLAFVHSGGNGNAISFSDKTIEMRKRMLSIHSNQSVNWITPSIMIYTQQLIGYNSIYHQRNLCGIDDVKYIVDIIYDLNNLNVNIDENKIYSIGFSSGSKFSHQLPYRIQQYNYSIAAIGAHAGIYGTDFGVNIPKPKHKVSVLAIHAYNDAKNDFYGSKTKSCMNQGHPSVVYMMNIWSMNNECNTSNGDIILYNDHDHSPLKRIWSDCPHVEMELFSLSNMVYGHSWTDQVSILMADFLQNKSIVW
eukprot:412729_1